MKLKSYYIAIFLYHGKIKTKTFYSKNNAYEYVRKMYKKYDIECFTIQEIVF